MVKIVIGILGIIFTIIIAFSANNQSNSNHSNHSADYQINTIHTTQVNIAQTQTTTTTKKTVKQQTTKQTTTKKKEIVITENDLFTNFQHGVEVRPSQGEEWMHYADRLNIALPYGFPDNKGITPGNKNTDIKRANIEYMIKVGNCQLQMDNCYYFGNNAYIDMQYGNISDYNLILNLYNLLKQYFSNMTISISNEQGTEWYITYSNGSSITLRNISGKYNIFIHYIYY